MSFLEENPIKTVSVESLENKVKTKPFLDDLIKENGLPEMKGGLLIVIGGGLLINCGAYIAERINCDLVLIPTTILSMADSSGGKVRVNTIRKGRSYKHFYKSFYEPNLMIIDERFLGTLPELQKRIGISEVVKHALFQSTALYEFLVSRGDELFNDQKLLLKAVLWAADLKRLCMEYDVEENENGSRPILRGGHDFSDRLEEDMHLQIPHGFAVLIGIIMQLEFEGNDELLEKAKAIYKVFNLPESLDDYEKIKKG